MLNKNQALAAITKAINKILDQNFEITTKDKISTLGKEEFFKIELIIELEKTLNISLDETALTTESTIQDLVTLVQNSYQEPA